MVKNPPSNAGDAGSIPGQETKIPHAMGKQQRRPCSGGCAQLERSPSAAMKILRAATKT